MTGVFCLIETIQFLDQEDCFEANLRKANVYIQVEKPNAKNLQTFQKNAALVLSLTTISRLFIFFSSFIWPRFCSLALPIDVVVNICQIALPIQKLPSDRIHLANFAGILILQFLSFY